MIPAQRGKIPKGGAHHRVSKGHGTHGQPWSQCPSALHRLHLLSLVWKGGAKWGNSGKPFKDTHYRLGLVCDQCFGCPTVMSRLSPPAWMPKLSKILCRIWIRPIHLTFPLNQGFTQGSKGSDIWPDPLPLESQKVQQRRHCTPVCWIHLLLSSLADKQLFLSQLWPGLPKRDTTDYS